MDCTLVPFYPVALLWLSPVFCFYEETVVVAADVWSIEMFDRGCDWCIPLMCALLTACVNRFCDPNESCCFACLCWGSED